MWSATLFQTVTGRLGPRLEIESMSWTIELNGTESISMKLRKSDLPSSNLKYWLEPWWASVVLMWDGVPVVAGPIITRPTETSDTVSIGCGGIRSILAKRLVVKEAELGSLNKSVTQYTGMSLGTIAKRVVQLSMSKPGGSLPITFAQADQLVADDANHQRTYRGFNVQNINCDDVLTKLSNVINGPDIMFRPKILRENQLTYEMWTGFENHPRIPQSQIPVWDTTAEYSTVADISTIVTGTYETSRVYSLGAGQDEGTLIKIVTNEVPINNQFPLLETVISVGNSENPVVVENYATSSIITNSESLLEIQMTVRGDGDIPFGQFWPGDLVYVIVKDWISLDDGLHKMRILSMSGNNSANVKISLQPESKFS